MGNDLIDVEKDNVTKIPLLYTKMSRASTVPGKTPESYFVNIKKSI